jgi:hypothetical protein
MGTAFWIVFLILVIYLAVEAVRTRAVEIVTLLILALLSILGASVYGWPG